MLKNPPFIACIIPTHMQSIHANRGMHERPQYMRQTILGDHALSLQMNKPEEPKHSISRVGKHDFHVRFDYPDGSVKVFDGKSWHTKS